MSVSYHVGVVSYRNSCVSYRVSYQYRSIRAVSYHAFGMLPCLGRPIRLVTPLADSLFAHVSYHTASDSLRQLMWIVLAESKGIG